MFWAITVVAVVDVMCRLLLLLLAHFEGDNYLLTIVIFCLCVDVVEWLWWWCGDIEDVLLFVNDNLDGDFDFNWLLDDGEYLELLS